MKTFIANVTTSENAEGIVIKKLNAWLFENNNKIAERNNIVINDEQEAIITEYSLRLKADDNAYTSAEIIEMLNQIHLYKSGYERAIENVMTMKEVLKKFKTIDPNYAIFTDFKYKGETIPQPVVEVMMKAETKEQCLAIHRFYLKCLSNPNGNSVKDLFNFIEKSKLIITPSGNFITFRRIKIVSEPVSKQLFKTVSNVYNKRLFSGVDLNEKAYKIVDGDLVGSNDESAMSIKEIHDSITTLEGRYTDNHSRTYDYRIGKNYVEKNYDSNHENLCSRGLHSGSFDYIESMHLGEQIVYCIVNPTKVVAVADNATKVRSSELYIAGLVNDWSEFKSKIESGVINFDIEDEQFENNYEGCTIEYNQVVGKSKENILLSEDELDELDEFENWSANYDDEDEEFEDEEDDELDEIEEVLSSYEAKVNKYRKMLEERKNGTK